ncbi:hypothetical protein R1sor_015883 [Riccia sorocarpa]|uniref:Uncharacterized protein n=1 Tax=Riccia sorocarpa TaxID=122646 RepID=A0ABD3HHF8_9MARC
MTSRTGRGRCSSSEETESVSDHEWKLKSQAEKIQNLEKQVAGRDDEVAQLNRQLEMKDDELDLLHGKLWLQETAEAPTESMYQKKVDMWSTQEANTKYYDVKLCRLDDYIDTEFIEENEWESLKEENRKLKAAAATRIGPEFFEELANLKHQFESLTEVCERYEELLRIYSKQIGVSFTPLSKVKKIWKQ